jgi:two-component system response regulator FixJ
VKVYIVDDDPDLQASLAIVLHRAGHEPEGFSDPLTFLDEAADLQPGSVLLDYNMPAMDGLEVQTRLLEMNAALAVILLTGVGEVPEAVVAMRGGAVDFLKKPYRVADLYAALERSEATLERLVRKQNDAARFSSLATLTPRELDVLKALSTGLQNKQVAHQLTISVRTVEMHRGRILKKLRTTTVGGAVALATEAGAL